MPEKFFDDYEIGEIHKTPGRTITEADMINFAGVSGSFHEIHTNKEYMKNSKFGRRLVHGLLVYSIARGLIYRMEVKPKTMAFYGIDKIKFTNPVFIDDTIHVEEEVTDMKERNEDSGIITFKDRVLNQDDEKVVEASPILLIERKS